MMVPLPLISLVAILPLLLISYWYSRCIKYILSSARMVEWQGGVGVNAVGNQATTPF